MFKTGARVKVKEWDEMVAEYGKTSRTIVNTPSGFVESMKKFCGSTATLAVGTDSMDAPTFIPTFDDPELAESAACYTWDSEMFKPNKSKYPTNHA